LKQQLYKFLATLVDTKSRWTKQQGQMKVSKANLSTPWRQMKAFSFSKGVFSRSLLFKMTHCIYIIF